jgi:hypothetical protein
MVRSFIGMGKVISLKAVSVLDLRLRHVVKHSPPDMHANVVNGTTALA